MTYLKATLILLSIRLIITDELSDLANDVKRVHPLIRSHDLSESSDVFEYKKFLKNDRFLMLEIRFPSGDNYLAKLEINKNLVAKNGVIETKKSKSLLNNPTLDRSCHFNGQFVNFSRSKLTVSLCNGLVCRN